MGGQTAPLEQSFTSAVLLWSPTQDLWLRSHSRGR